jgi:hypothetical protein
MIEKAKDPLLICDWEEIRIREAQLLTLYKRPFLACDYMLDHSTLRLIFDSVLITVDLHHPFEGNDEKPYSVRRTDRTDFDL